MIGLGNSKPLILFHLEFVISGTLSLKPENACQILSQKILTKGDDLNHHALIVREPEGWSVSYWGANSTIHF